MRKNLRLFLWAFLPVFLGLRSLTAAPLSESELRQAAAAWLSASAVFQKEVLHFEVLALEQLRNSDTEILPIWLLQLAPSGYLLLTADDGLPPILGFSTSALDVLSRSRTQSTFRALLIRQGERYQQLLAEPETRSEDYHQENREQWQRLLQAGVRADPIQEPGTIEVEPMVEQPWSQEGPLNLYLPRSAEEVPAVTGCEPLAVALIMNFHQWPPRGTGSKTWTSQIQPDYNVGGTMHADFSVPYDWNLQDSYDPHSGQPTTSELAVARLLFDLGVALDSQFDTEGTGTSTTKCVPAMRDFFRYPDLIQGETSLFQRIKDDIEAGLPVHASIPGHSFVVSGLAQEGGNDYYFLNYGWGGYLSGWYKLNDGDERSVVNSAITNFQPAKQALFRPIPYEQGVVFALSWDFPRIHTAEAFRLSAKRGGVTTVISSEIPGTDREYSFSGLASGPVQFFLEAKVDGVWQDASDPLSLLITAEAAFPPEFFIEQEIVMLQSDGTALITVQLNDPEATLTASSSRPDLYPEEQIRISGNGNEREVLLIPADIITGNVLVWLTASNADDQSVTHTVSVLWSGLTWIENLEEAKILAEADDKKIFLVIGLDADSNSNTLRLNYCEISDIRAALENQYILCYLQNVESAVIQLIPELNGNQSISLPVTAILRYVQSWEASDVHIPATAMDQLLLVDLRAALEVGNLQLQPKEQQLSYQAQSVFIRVIAAGNWSISSNVGFLQPLRSSGTGLATVECNLAANSGEQEREAQLTVMSAGLVRTCQIRQMSASFVTVEFQAETKDYDGTVVAQLAGDPTVISGVAVEHDAWVDFSNAWAEFSDADPGVDKVVMLYGVVLLGEDAEYYRLPAVITGQGTILQNQVTIPSGWNSITLLLELDSVSQQSWTSELLTFQYQNRSWTRVDNPEPGKAYLIFNQNLAELGLSGKQTFSASAPLPESPLWTLQSVTTETELPLGMQAWRLSNGKYSLISGNLQPGIAYWLFP